MAFQKQIKNQDFQKYKLLWWIKVVKRDRWLALKVLVGAFSFFIDLLKRLFKLVVTIIIRGRNPIRKRDYLRYRLQTFFCRNCGYHIGMGHWARPVRTQSLYNSRLPDFKRFCEKRTHLRKGSLLGSGPLSSPPSFFIHCLIISSAVCTLTSFYRQQTLRLL